MAAQKIAVRHIAASWRLGCELFGELHEPTEGGDAAGPYGIWEWGSVLGGSVLGIGAGSERGAGGKRRLS